ncbi:CbrC family protein [Kitasatospora kazusensis]|uniref:CbrC family protein n=1 Tax=Kitasatospora kazusensis TaxID=407974 RepID=UPI003CD0675F
MSTSLPFFRYHPDPVANESIRESAETCARCNPQHGVDLHSDLLHRPRRQREILPLVHR